MLSEDVIACARLVEKGDPDRFRATMAAPVSARSRLFPLYAFNVEVTRAPWMTSEPTIAAMRLQWWRDVLVEIEAGGLVRRHEVTLPLASVIAPQDAVLLDDLIMARYWDIEREGFADMAALETYLRHTAGTLMVVASRVLGGGADDAAAEVGFAHGVAQFLKAVPSLQRAGRRPLPDKNPEAIRDLTTRALAALDNARRVKSSKAIAPAFLPAWQTRMMLKKMCQTPQRVLDGTIEIGPIRSQLRLAWQAVSGSF